MQTRTIIDRIEIEPQTGNVGVRIRKQIVADDGIILSSDYHRMMIDAGSDPAAQIAAVNAHLAAMGFAPVEPEDVSLLSSALAPLAGHRAAKAEEAREKAAR